MPETLWPTYQVVFFLLSLSWPIMSGKQAWPETDVFFFLFFLLVQRQSCFLIVSLLRLRLAKMTQGHRYAPGLKWTAQAHWESLRHMTAPAVKPAESKPQLIGFFVGKQLIKGRESVSPHWSANVWKMCFIQLRFEKRGQKRDGDEEKKSS